jgi:competence protein ComGF
VIVVALEPPTIQLLLQVSQLIVRRFVLAEVVAVTLLRRILVLLLLGGSSLWDFVRMRTLSPPSKPDLAEISKIEIHTSFSYRIDDKTSALRRIAETPATDHGPILQEYGDHNPFFSSLNEARLNSSRIANQAGSLPLWTRAKISPLSS